MAAEVVTLDIRGPRGALTVERAKELAEPILSGAKVDITQLVLSTWAFSAESAAVFADAIERLPQLDSAILADIIAGRPEVEGLAVFRVLGAALAKRRLKRLDLSDNAVGPKGVEAVREMMTEQADLEHLLFCNCGISAEALRSIADIVLFTIPTKLKTLHFYNNMSGSGGAVALADIVAASPLLEDLRFSSSRGGKEGAVALANALAGCGSLQRLDLSDNIFGLEGAAAVCRMLGGGVPTRHLLDLNVGDISMGDAGVRLLASSLVRSPCRSTLQSLSVAANDITAAGAPSLGRLLRRLVALRHLRLEENELGDEGLTALAGSLAARAAGFAASSAGAETSETSAGSGDPLARVNVAGVYASARGLAPFARAAAAALPALAVLDVSANDELHARGVRQVRAAAAQGRHRHIADADAAAAWATAVLVTDESQQEEEDDAEEEDDDADEEVVPATDADDDDSDTDSAAAGPASPGSSGIDLLTCALATQASLDV